jgi:hypothetical protein
MAVVYFSLCCIIIITSHWPYSLFLVKHQSLKWIVVTY